MYRRTMMPIKRSLDALKRSSIDATTVKPANRFSLLSYNILSPSYMWPQVYGYVPDQYKEWSYRQDLLEYELFNLYRADIMCFQEMRMRDYDSYWSPRAMQQLNMGSNFMAKSPPQYWRRQQDELDGCGIFYSLDMFDFISSRGIYLNQLLDAFTPEELTYLDQRTLKLTDGAGNLVSESTLLQFLRSKNQVCLFTSLKHKPTGLIFVVINTHLYWKYDDVKLTQCMVIMRELSKIINGLLKDVNVDISNDKVRILFTGDLNSTSDSVVLNFLRGQYVTTLDLNTINPMRLYLNHCVYDDIPSDWFDNTCYSGKLKGIFDYIWYHDTHFQLNKILRGREVSQELDYTHQQGLPNVNHPSDHIPLLAEFNVLE